MKKSYYVKALWDSEANVWYSESDVPGLNLEADTLGEFEKEMIRLVPELLDANVPESRVVNFPALEFSASRRIEVRAT